MHVIFAPTPHLHPRMAIHVLVHGNNSIVRATCRHTRSQAGDGERREVLQAPRVMEGHPLLRCH